MKRYNRPLVLLVAAILALTFFPAHAQEATLIEGVLTRELPVVVVTERAPTPGVSLTTGLPTDEAFVPIVVVLDNEAPALPHWGIQDADVIYQVPNAGGGATKLLALFAYDAPELAGGVRSARTPFVDVALSWGAALSYCGSPGSEKNEAANVPALVRKSGLSLAGLNFDLIGNNDYSSRMKGKAPPHNLSAHVRQIRQILTDAGHEFAPRGFLFADSPAIAGVPAQEIQVLHYGETKKPRSYEESDSTFAYDAGQNAYLRSTIRGPYVDRDTPETPIPFANVIILRTPFSYEHGNYVVLNSMVGSGAADIFTGGRYIAGGWTRTAQDAPTVFLNDQGAEMALQPGKTFIIITNDVTEVSYR